MNALIIEEKTPKARRTARAIMGVYFTIFGGYFLFTEAVGESHGLLFWAAAAATIMAIILLVANTLWISDKQLLNIDNTKITSKVSGSKFDEEWVQVSKITIGVSYIIFFVDGGRKQRKLDLSQFLYNDVGNVKSKLIELCEYKNIPYVND